MEQCTCKSKAQLDAIEQKLDTILAVIDEMTGMAEAVMANPMSLASLFKF